MLGSIICAIIAIACLTQGAMEGAIAMGILAAILFFFFGSKSTSGNTNTAPKPKKEEKPQPDNKYRATPSMLAHYKSSPVVAQIARDLRECGAVVSISISQNGSELTGNGGGYYKYVFKDHGYQSLTLQEQEAFLRAIVEMLPYSHTYSVSYEHRENSTVPLHYSVSTSFYRENQYRWNRATGVWEKMTKI